MSLTTKITADLEAMVTNPLDIEARSSSIKRLQRLSLGNGTGAGLADLSWSDRRTLGPSATEDLDLAGLLTGPFGATITFARIRALLVVTDPANVNNVVVGGQAVNGWLGPFGALAHTIAIQPGDFLLQTARGATAWPVTAGTADLLRVANSGAGTGVEYEIVLIGASA